MGGQTPLGLLVTRKKKFFIGLSVGMTFVGGRNKREKGRQSFGDEKGRKQTLAHSIQFSFQ